MALDTSLRYYVAGHRGMVGSAIVRQLEALQEKRSKQNGSGK